MNQLATTIQNAMRLIREGKVATATADIKRNLLEISRVSGSPDAEITQPYDAPARHSVIEGEYVCEPPDRATESSFQSKCYAGPAGSRAYKLFMPAGIHTTSLPLVVMLHGCTQSPDDFALGTGMNELAAVQPCIIAYPEQATGANGMKCWNWFKSADQQRDRGEPAIIAGITREIISNYDVDASRVYIAGLSAGGAMAVVMGRTYPDLYAAVGVHSGIAYAVAHDAASAFTAMKNTSVPNQAASEDVPLIPTILLHGDSDGTVHPSNAERLAQQFSANAETCEPTVAASGELNRDRGRRSFTRTLWRNQSGKVVVEYWLVHGAGHAWFGGNPKGSHTDPKGPDASKEILRFFLHHQLPTRTDS